MLDKISLSQGESIKIDSTANNVTFYVLSGLIDLIKDTETIAQLGEGEWLTMPLNTGIYRIQAAQASTVLIFRFFIY